MSELRARAAAPELKGRTAYGHAAVFNSESRDLGGFKEIVTPQAFNKAAGDKFPGVKAKWEHRDLLGTVAAGTARLRIDDKGLAFEIDIPRSREDVVEFIERGDVRGASFEFQKYQDHWEQRGYGGIPIRYLDSVRPLDVSIVSDPAYLAAQTSVRSMEAALESFAAWVEAPLEEVVADFERRNLSRYYKRSDIMPTPTPLEVAQLKTSEPSGITGEEAQRWLEAHKPSNGMDWRAAKLDLMRRRWDIDASDAQIAALGRGRQLYGPLPDDSARQRQVELLSLGTQRRVRQLAEQGYDIPAETATGNPWTHHGPAPVATSQRENNWLRS